MKSVIIVIAEIVNNIHDLILELSKAAGFTLNDKDLHLWVMGILGIFSFFFVHVLFKSLAQYSITAISFIYTFTVMVVIVFAIEIQQKITGRGNMEFDDAVIGLWGFLLFFFIYLVIKGIIVFIKKQTSKKQNGFNQESIK
ncbi:hypothetical protein [Mesobacillus jeotgali]|uniref:hypothetical protein n=1 Tax=Mesobacillus jeotgali TaxID=129985 RepID=UPI001CFE5B97|nr:hypothetical protein [Mesobacillus jeotgali]